MQQLAGSLEFCNDTNDEQLVSCNIVMPGLVLSPGQPSGQSTVNVEALHPTQLWCEPADKFGLAIVNVDNARTLGGDVKLGSWMEGSFVGTHGIVDAGCTAKGQIMPFGSTCEVDGVSSFPAAELRLRFRISPQTNGYFTWNASFGEPAARPPA